MMGEYIYYDSWDSTINLVSREPGRDPIVVPLETPKGKYYKVEYDACEEFYILRQFDSYVTDSIELPASLIELMDKASKIHRIKEAILCMLYCDEPLESLEGEIQQLKDLIQP